MRCCILQSFHIVLFIVIYINYISIIPTILRQHTTLFIMFKGMQTNTGFLFMYPLAQKNMMCEVICWPRLISQLPIVFINLNYSGIYKVKRFRNNGKQGCCNCLHLTYCAVLSTIYFLEFKKFNLVLSTILKFLEELGKFSSLVSTI